MCRPHIASRYELTRGGFHRTLLAGYVASSMVLLGRLVMQRVVVGYARAALQRPPPTQAWISSFCRPVDDKLQAALSWRTSSARVPRHLERRSWRCGSQLIDANPALPQPHQPAGGDLHHDVDVLVEGDPLSDDRCVAQQLLVGSWCIAKPSTRSSGHLHVAATSGKRGCANSSASSMIISNGRSRPCRTTVRLRCQWAQGICQQSRRGLVSGRRASCACRAFFGGYSARR